MTIFRTPVNGFRQLLILGAVLLAPGLLWAQQDGPGFISVRFVEVNSGANADFVAAMRDLAEEQEASGQPALHVYQRIRGDNGFTIITVDDAFNDLPQGNLSPGLFGRVTRTIASTSVLTMAIYPELSISSGGGLAPGGEFMRARVRTVSPGNGQAYFDWHADEFTPALREAGVTDLRAGRVILGGNNNTFVRFGYSDEFPGGGANVAETIGEREFQRLIARENALIVNSEDFMYRFRADMSFTAGQ
jgi:hypothetical protein